MTPLDPRAYLDLVRRAIAEDVGPGDLTTRLLVPAEARATAQLIAKSECVVSGLAVAAAVFSEVDATVVVTPRVVDGHRCRTTDVIADLTGPAAALLTDRGLRPIRHFWHMQIDLEGPVESGSAPAGIEIEGVEPREDLRAVHAIVEAAFADDPGENTEPFDRWAA